MGVPIQAVLGLLVGLVLGNRRVDGANEHWAPFTTFCGLIRLTESKFDLPTTVRLPNGLEDDLVKLNMTTADDSWYNLFSGKEEDTWDKVKDKEPFKTWVTEDPGLEKMYGKWNTAKKALLDDAAGSKKEFLRPPATRQRKVAAERIRALLVRYREMDEEYVREAKALNGLAGQIEEKFKKALTNSEAKEATVTKDSFGSDRGGNDYACGRASSPTAAGKSLANDLVCICTATTSNYANNLCENTLTGSSNSVNGVGWSNDGGASALTGYGLVYKKCPEAPPGFKPSAHTLQRQLAKFWALFGKSAVASTVHNLNAYAIGGGPTGVTSNSCAGTGIGSVCVTYKGNLHVASPTGIPWLKALEQALELLEQLEADEKKMHALRARAESLRDAAWVAYAEARMPDPDGTVAPIAELGKTGQPGAAAITGAVDGATPGAETQKKETAFIPRSSLLWTLLI